jgi:hypothetical protein
MADDADEIARIRATIGAFLREGYAYSGGDRETHGRVTYEPARGVFVADTYDMHVLDPSVPIETRLFADDAQVLAWLAPSERTAEGWRAVLGRLNLSGRSGRSGVGRLLRGVPVDGLAFDGVLPDGVAWSARADGVEERHLGVSEWTHVRFLVTLGSSAGVSPEAGPFSWRVPGPDHVDWCAEGLGALRESVETRLVARLAIARLLDFSTPEPLPGGGVWSARHMDRYEDDGVGFALTVGTVAGEARLHHTLARPGSTDPQRERTAARTRLTKWMRKVTS